MTKHLYTGQEPDKFPFIQLPTFLYDNPEFNTISEGAKTLYAHLLNRSKMSQKNHWNDGSGRVFVYCPIKEVMNRFHCSKQKAGKMMTELEQCGLIERVKQGFGKPDKVLLKTPVLEVPFD